MVFGGRRTQRACVDRACSTRMWALLNENSLVPFLYQSRAKWAVFLFFVFWFFLVLVLNKTVDYMTSFILVRCTSALNREAVGNMAIESRMYG